MSDELIDRITDDIEISTMLGNVESVTMMEEIRRELITTRDLTSKLKDLLYCCDGMAQELNSRN